MAELIWLTRPQKDSELLAATLAERGVKSVIAPMMHIDPMAATLPAEMPDALILTSRYAAHSIPEQWKNLPIYCVGEATAHTARALGCPRTIAGDKDVLALVAMLARTLKPHARVLYLSGAEVRLNISALAASRNLIIERCVVYRATASHQLDASIVRHLRRGDMHAVIAFSPRTAEIISSLFHLAQLEKCAEAMEFYGLSLDVAEAAGGLPWKSLFACGSPTQEAMVELIVSRHPLC